MVVNNLLGGVIGVPLNSHDVGEETSLEKKMYRTCAKKREVSKTCLTFFSRRAWSNVVWMNSFCFVTGHSSHIVDGRKSDEPAGR